MTMKRKTGYALEGEAKSFLLHSKFNLPSAVPITCEN